MSKIALIVRHRAKPGQRELLRATWERFIKPNALKNPHHLEYYFSYDRDCEERVTAFQIFSSIEAKNDFISSPWYPDYIQEISQHIAEPPEITELSLMWSKNEL